MNKLKTSIFSTLVISSLALAQHHHGNGAAIKDSRVAVEYPPAMK